MTSHSQEAGEIRYLRVNDVIALHRGIMIRLRRPPEPLRDEGLLEAAVMRPRMAAYYEEADLVRQAALLAVSLSQAQAQAFVDGNKRTALASAETFLRLNDLAYHGRSVHFARQLELVAERTDSLDAATERFEAWLRDHVGPRPSGERRGK